jgi:hypothetical protein
MIEQLALAQPLVEIDADEDKKPLRGDIRAQSCTGKSQCPIERNDVLPPGCISHNCPGKVDMVMQ